jgi:NitT/TauT family transport system substrate-binding protein
MTENTPIKGLKASRLVAVALLALLGELAPDPAAAQTKLVVAVPHAVLFDTAVPIYIAQEKGFFRDAGLTVETVVVRGGGENVQAAVSGSVQIVIGTGFFAVLSAFQKGAPVKVLASEMTGLPDLFWYTTGNAPHRKLEDLAGKRIAYSTAGASSHMAVLAVADQLKAKGLPAPQGVSLGGFPDALTALKTGQTDAAFGVPPLFFDQIEKGELRIVFRGDEIQKFNDVTIRVTFANADYLQKNPETVRAFFKAYQKALDFIFDNRQETVKIWLKRGLKSTEALAAKSYDFYTKTSMAMKPVKGVQTTMEDAVKFNFLKQPLSQAELDRLIDLKYLP